MARIIDLFQGSPQWLSWRKTKITASEMPLIMGASPYGTAYTLWQEKLGFKDPQKETEAMRAGKDKEVEFREMFYKLTGIVACATCIESEEIPWAGASLDGLSDDGKIFVEFKLNNASNHDFAVNGKLPEAHRIQVQHQMTCMDIPVKAYYLSHNKGDYRLVEVFQDDVLEQAIIDAGTKFKMQLDNFITPDLTAADYVYITDSRLIEKAKRLQEVTKERKALEKEEEVIKRELIEIVDRNAQIGPYKLQQQVRKGSLDLEKCPFDLEPYRKNPSCFWTFKEISE